MREQFDNSSSFSLHAYRPNSSASFAAAPLSHTTGEMFNFLGGNNKPKNNVANTPSDAPDIVNILDQGWFATTHPTTTKRRAANTNVTATNTTTASSAIEALHHLPSSSHFEHHTATHATNNDNDNINTANWYDAISVDSPRSTFSTQSIVSAAMSLPQSYNELEGLQPEDLSLLAEEAELLQRRATVAVQLARNRLLETQQQRYGNNGSSTSRNDGLRAMLGTSGSQSVLTNQHQQQRDAINNNTTQLQTTSTNPGEPWSFSLLMAMIFDLWVMAIVVANMALKGIISACEQLAIITPSLAMCMEITIGFIKIATALLEFILGVLNGLRSLLGIPIGVLILPDDCGLEGEEISS